MKNIHISNIDSLINSIHAVGQVVTGAKFIINTSGLTCLFKSQNARVKLTNFNTTCEDEISFCINDFSKFLNYMKLIKSNEQVTNFDLQFQKTYIGYKGNLVEFKYTLCREEIIAQNIDQEIITNLDIECVFETDYETVRNILSNKNLISDDLQSITYRVEQDKIKTKMIFAHLSDVQNPSTNAIKLYFGKVLQGNMLNNIYINTERLQLATILKGENIVITKANKNVIIIDLEERNEQTDELITQIKIYVSLLRGPE